MGQIFEFPQSGYKALKYPYTHVWKESWFLNGQG